MSLPDGEGGGGLRLSCDATSLQRVRKLPPPPLLPRLATPIIGHHFNNPIFHISHDVLHVIKVRGCVTNWRLIAEHLLCGCFDVCAPCGLEVDAFLQFTFLRR